jgi:hypothetical protein
MFLVSPATAAEGRRDETTNTNRYSSALRKAGSFEGTLSRCFFYAPCIGEQASNTFHRRQLPRPGKSSANAKSLAANAVAPDV